MFIMFALEHPVIAILLVDILGGLIGYLTVRIFIKLRRGF